MNADAVELWEIGRATLVLSVATLLVAGLRRRRGSTTPAILRCVCLLILVQGWFIYRLPISVPWHEAPIVASAPRVDLSLLDEPAMPPRVESPREPATIVVAPSVSSWRVPSIQEIVLVLWLCGPLVLLAMIVRDFRRFVASSADAEAAPAEWQEQWQNVCNAAGVRPAIPMFATRNIGPLLCWNAGGHRLLVPVGYWRDLSSDQREAVLRHELAHYERGDIWKSLVIRLIVLPQWFNPFAWRLVRWFDEAAEQACDRAAVRGVPHMAGQYARALMSLGQTSKPAMSFVTSASGSTLARRIREIVALPAGSDSAAKQIMVFSLPIVLTMAGLVRVELVAKEPVPAARPEPANKAAPKGVPANANNDGKAKAAEFDRLVQLIPTLEAKAREVRAKLEATVVESEALSEAAKKNPGDNDARLRAEEKEKAVLDAAAELERMRDEIEQLGRHADKLRKVLLQRKQQLRAQFVGSSQQLLKEKLANDAWLLWATIMLSVEDDSKYSSLSDQIAIFHDVAARDWKSTDFDKLDADWNRVIRGEKIDELPDSLRALIEVRTHWQDLNAEPERKRQSNRDRAALELMKAAAAFPHQKESASDYWRKQIDLHPQSAYEYRLAYLGSIAREGAQSIDVVLAEPLIVATSPANAAGFVALCEILHTFSAQSQTQGAEFARFRQKLHDILSDNNAATTVYAEWGSQFADAKEKALERLYRSYRDANRPAEAEAILRSVLSGAPKIYEAFAIRVGISALERRQWQMRRVVRVNFDDVPVSRAIDTIFHDVVLPYWVDLAVAGDESRVQLKADGPWFDVLNELLAKTKYEQRFLRDDVMWIGPPAQRRQAEAMLGRALERAPVGDSSTAARLREPISLHFVETPVEDVAEFLKDYLRENLVSLENEKATSIYLNSLPTFLALSLICEPLEIDWCAEEGVIVIGSPKQIENVQKRAADFRRRASDLERQATNGNVAASALSRPISFDFMETPLTDIVEFVGAYSRVKIVLDSKETADLPTTLQLEQVSLGWGLELVLMEHELHWELLGSMVFIGDEPTVSAARSKIQSRIAKREGYPQSLRTELVKDVQIEAEKAPLFAVVESLAKSVQAPIETSEKVRLRPVTFRAEPMPLDLALDLLCLQNNLSWRWTPDGVIRFE